MERERLLQLRIWGWQTKNHKKIYMGMAILCLAVLPGIGFLFSLKTLPDDCRIVYGYFFYIVQTLVFGIGCIPVLMTMHMICHMEVGDCIVLSPEWNQRKQCLISFAFSAVLFFILMTGLAAEFRKGVSAASVFKDAASLIVVLWVFVSVCMALSFFFRNVYLALILVELYGVLFCNMAVHPNAVWNLFSITGEQGILWIIRVVLYLAFGFLIQEILTNASDKRIL